jgi:DNA-binding CsgD family transcriptional regulator
MGAGLVSPVMVGRSEQLAGLRQLCELACAGSPVVALIGGEAGVGKTRLITEFTAGLAGRAVLLSGGCVDLSGADLAYAPFTAALRGLVRQLGTEDVASLLPGAAPVELGRLLPALGVSRPRGTGLDDDAGTARARLFEEFLGLLENLADREPVVLVIEDAHWADQSSQDLLSFLARNLQAATALLIVVSYRTDDLDRGHPLRPLLAELERLPRVHRIELRRLSRREVIAQIRGILDGPGPARLAEEVAGRSDGNPLFVEVLLESGGRLPQSLADLLLARVRQLPEKTQRVLGAAAVAGPWFGQPLLEAATELAEGALSDALRPAVAAGVLVTDDDGFGFRHALIREAVLAGELPGERKRWHARLARALEADPGLAQGAMVAGEIAGHWYAAGEAARALPAAWRAAADAAGALAYAEQLVMLERVLELWDAVADATALTGTSRVEVLDQAVAAGYLAGEPERGVRLADAAMSEPGIRDDPVRAFFITERRAAMSLLLRRADVTGLREAADAVADTDPARPRVLAALAAQLMDAQLPEEAYERGEEALAAARRGRDLIAEASALITVAAVSARRGELLALQLPRLAEARAIAESAGHDRLLMRALQWQASLLEDFGEHEQAAAAARHGIAMAAAAGLARAAGATHPTSLASALTSLGRWDEAGEVIEHALSMLPPSGPRLQLLCLAGSIALARGDDDAAAAAHRGACQEEPAREGSFGIFEALLLADLEVSLLAARGDIATALAAAQRILQAAEGRISHLQRWLWPLLDTSARVACVATAPGASDGVAAAAEVLRLVARHAEAAPPLTPVQDAHAAACRATAGRQDAAAWDGVASAWERLGEPYCQARALVSAAEAALADGGRDVAGERLRQAASLAGPLGAGPLLEEISALAKRARIDVARGEADDRASPRLGLTDRELEVLRLVAAGRNNRDIAAELFISAKTASVHVSNILAKLGVHTRVEAAAIAHQAGVIGTA